MNCTEALPLIHEYVDGDLELDQSLALREHLSGCAPCTSRLQAYEKTEALVRVLPRPEPPAHLTSSIMASLPPVSSNRNWVRWIRRHPAATAAAAFLVIMVSSFLSLWNQGAQLAVRGDDLDGIVIEGHRVIVPSKETIDGDLIVEGGAVQVDGDVMGNLVVIDGSIAMASTAHISGNITQVDQALDWIWFKVSEWFGALLPQSAAQP
jgi:anti-sigma factor RsiW